MHPAWSLWWPGDPTLRAEWGELRVGPLSALPDFPKRQGTYSVGLNCRPYSIQPYTMRVVSSCPDGGCAKARPLEAGILNRCFLISFSLHSKLQM